MASVRPPAAVCALSCAVALTIAAPALADECFRHEGSLMRFVLGPDGYVMRYEELGETASDAGAEVGDVRLNGIIRDGTHFIGAARLRFAECPGTPYEFEVTGQVLYEPYRIVVEGTREALDQCRPTGERVTDTLTFDFAGDC